MSIRSTRSQRSATGLIFLIFGIAFLLFAVFGLTEELGGPDPLVSAPDVSALSMSDDNSYYLGEAVILDCYATETDEDDDITEYYCAVAFENQDSAVGIASLAVPPASPLCAAILSYLEDDSQGFGDCSAVMYCTTSSLSVSSDLGTFYQEYLDTLDDAGLSEFTPVYLNMTYVSDNEADFLAHVEADNRTGLIMAVSFGIFGIFFLLLGYSRRRKHDDDHGGSTPRRTWPRKKEERMNGPEIL